MKEFENPIGVLDIGSYSSKFIIFSKIDEKIKILSSLSIKTNGIKKGIISDLEKLSSCLKELIGISEETAKVQIKKIYISINPLNFHSLSFCQSKNIGTFEIDEVKDLQFLVNSGMNLFRSSFFNAKIIHVFNYNLRLDKVNFVENPCGLNADTLENDMTIVHCKNNTYKNYQKLIQKSYINSETFIFSPYTLSLASYNETPLSDLLMTIDFGHEKTSISIFKNNNFIFSSVIPLGSWHISNDISKGLNLTYEISDNLKHQYASCDVENKFSNDKYLESDNMGIKSMKKVSNNILNNITQSRVEELIELINKEISFLYKINNTFNKVVITGSGSNLKGYENLLKKNLKIKSHSYEKFSSKIKLDNNLKDEFDTSVSIMNLIHKNYKFEISSLKNKKIGFFDKINSIFN